MKQLTTCIFTLALLVSCSGGDSSFPGEGKKEVADSTASAATPEESDGAIEIEEPQAMPGLTWNDLGPAEYGVPRSEIVLTIGDRKIVLDTISNDCSEIEKSEYKTYGIPKDALTAFGGWFAGGGDYFYLARNNGKAAVYHGWVDEAQEDDGYHWKKVKW